MDVVEARGARIPRIGFGTWQLEGTDCQEGVRDALELGYRHLDTARAYGNEREVGRGLADSGVDRDEVFVTTKVWRDDLEPSRLRRSAESSLRDLGLDHVDLLLVHWPHDQVPLERTLEEMERLRDEDRTRHVGVSNFPPPLLRRALELAPVVCDQVELHPFLGQDALLEIAAERELAITAYSPLAGGRVPEDPVLAEIAEQVGGTPAQVALRWLLDRDPRIVVIPKASSHDRRAENLQAFDLSLSREQRARIDVLPKDRRDIDPEFAPDWEG